MNHFETSSSPARWERLANGLRARTLAWLELSFVQNPPRIGFLALDLCLCGVGGVSRANFVAATLARRPVWLTRELRAGIGAVCWLQLPDGVQNDALIVMFRGSGKPLLLWSTHLNPRGRDDATNLMPKGYNVRHLQDNRDSRHFPSKITFTQIK